MDEKESNSLTIGDILDQLVKPSVIEGRGVPTPRQASPTMPTLPSAPTRATPEVKMPQLGKAAEEPANLSANSQTKSELRLSVRTMSDDLERLKRGQKILPSEIQKTLIPTPSKLSPPKPQPPPATIIKPKLPEPPAPTPSFRPPLSTQPSSVPSNIASLPPLRPAQPIKPPPTPVRPMPAPIRPAPTPVRPMPLPPISAPSSPTHEPGHYHPEKIVGEEALPPFLGAPIPKKVKKPTEEKIEYKLIAKIIGSGMTTGIVATLIMAGAAYGLVYFFYLNKAETPITTPTPTIGATTTPIINELETIFGSVSSINFQLPSQREEAVSNLKTFVNNQTLATKEFRRLNITVQPSSEQKNLSFTDLMDNLSLNYPPEIKDEIKDNRLVLLYGQEEQFNGQAESRSKKIVFIAEVKDLSKISQIMNAWEQTIPDDLKEIFDIDPSKQASQAFLDNEHRGVQIRYKNFPLPDKTIDYAIVSSLTNHHYLIITNSRESMYSPVDKIQGL